MARYTVHIRQSQWNLMWLLWPLICSAYIAWTLDLNQVNQIYRNPTLHYRMWELVSPESQTDKNIFQVLEVLYFHGLLCAKYGFTSLITEVLVVTKKKYCLACCKNPIMTPKYLYSSTSAIFDPLKYTSLFSLFFPSFQTAWIVFWIHLQSFDCGSKISWHRPTWWRHQMETFSA